MALTLTPMLCSRFLRPPHGGHNRLYQWSERVFDGMLRAYECYSADGDEVVGVSVWDSTASRERYRLSEIETERRREMSQYVVDESSGLYVGRELRIPR